MGNLELHMNWKNSINNKCDILEYQGHSFFLPCIVYILLRVNEFAYAYFTVDVLLTNLDSKISTRIQLRSQSQVQHGKGIMEILVRILAQFLHIS